MGRGCFSLTVFSRRRHLTPRGILQVSESGVHRPHVAGIHGRSNDGAYSLVLAGGYEDDVVSGRAPFCVSPVSVCVAVCLSVYVFLCPCCYSVCRCLCVSVRVCASVYVCANVCLPVCL